MASTTTTSLASTTTTTLMPPCGHSACQLGLPLDPDCDPCVETVCDADPYCCYPTGLWDEHCLAAVPDWCGHCACADDGSECSYDHPCYSPGVCEDGECVGMQWLEEVCGPSTTTTSSTTTTTSGSVPSTTTTTLPPGCSISDASSADFKTIFADFFAQNDEGFVVPEHSFKPPYEAGLGQDVCPAVHDTTQWDNYTVGWYKVLRKAVDENAEGAGIKVRLFVPWVQPGAGGLGGVFFVPLVVDVELRKVKQSKTTDVCDQWAIGAVADARFARGGIERYAGTSACGRLPWLSRPKLTSVVRVGNTIAIAQKGGPDTFPVPGVELLTDPVLFRKNANGEWTLHFMPNDRYRLIPAARTKGIYEYFTGKAGDCNGPARPCTCSQFVGGATRDGYTWKPGRYGYVTNEAVSMDDRGRYGWVTWSSPLRTLADVAADRWLSYPSIADALYLLPPMTALIKQIGPPPRRSLAGSPGGQVSLWENDLRRLVPPQNLDHVSFNFPGMPLPIEMTADELGASDCKKFEDELAPVPKVFDGYGEGDWGDFPEAATIGTLTPQ